MGGGDGEEGVVLRCRVVDQREDSRGQEVHYVHVAGAV